MYDPTDPLAPVHRAYWQPDELRRIQSAVIGIAGAGGLGSNCAACLVRAGVRRLRIVDHDRVQRANLNRQFYFLEQIGQDKVTALAENLHRIDPACVVETITARVDPSNARKFFTGCDIVIEAFDAPAAKAMLIEQLLHTGPFLVTASGLAGVGALDRIVTRRLQRDLVLIGDLVTGIDRAAPVAPRVSMVAAMQADAALSFLLAPEKGGS